MSDWYEADATWAALGYGTREEYVARFVVEGRFHPGVHADVVKSFRTAVHLMALAWYHYPAYDEAVRKIYAVFEMAVRLRCQQLGISTRNPARTRDLPLVQLIDAICDREPAKDLRPQLHYARGRRNYFSHPRHHSFAGGMFSGQVRPLINLLNELYLDEADAVGAAAYLADLRRRAGWPLDDLCTWELGDTPYLIHQLRPAAAHCVGGRWLSFWSFEPVLPNAAAYLAGDQLLPVVTQGLADVRVADGALVGQDVAAGRPARVAPVTDPLGHALYQHFRQGLSAAPEKQVRYSRWSQQGQIHERLHEFKYQHYWQTAG